MMLDLAFLSRAELDLESILIYLGQAMGAPNTARSHYERIMHALELLCETPTLGRMFASDRFERDGYRTYLVAPYRVFYRVDGDTLTVVRILHSRQEIDDYTFVEDF